MSEPSTVDPAPAGQGCQPSELDARAKKVLKGQATYYHDSLAGNKTASGEVYSPSKLSAAHRTLPFGTRLRVTRLGGKRPQRVCVTVNDRGPFAGPRRILDLSRAGAEALDMIRAGVVDVRIEVL